MPESKTVVKTTHNYVSKRYKTQLKIFQWIKLEKWSNNNQNVVLDYNPKHKINIHESTVVLIND